VVMMERHLSQELVVIDLQGENLEEHIVFHILLVVLVGQTAATIRVPRFSLQLHLIHTFSPLFSEVSPGLSWWESGRLCRRWHHGVDGQRRLGTRNSVTWWNSQRKLNVSTNGSSHGIMTDRRLSVIITTQRLVSGTHRVPREDLVPLNAWSDTSSRSVLL
jgi:hypothetical protein